MGTPRYNISKFSNKNGISEIEKVGKQWAEGAAGRDGQGRFHSFSRKFRVFKKWAGESCPLILPTFWGPKMDGNGQKFENAKNQNKRKTPEKSGEMMVGDTELESVTSCMSSKRSNQLS